LCFSTPSPCPPGDIICGRAARVWSACRLADVDKKPQERQVRFFQGTATVLTLTGIKEFVFKDLWQDTRREGEGVIYDKLGDIAGTGRCYAHWSVSCAGSSDNTSEIRNGVTLPKKYMDLRDRAIRTSGNMDRGSKDKIHEQDLTHPILPKRAAIQVQNAVLLPEYYNETGIFRARQHKRVIVESRGWRLVNFVDLQELVGVFHDVVNGELASLFYVLNAL
jgi:hypothetical protein